MQGDQHPSRVILGQTRERVLEALSEAFARDEIGLDEFERRVDAAYAAATPDALEHLLSDLSAAVRGAACAAPAVAPPGALAAVPAPSTALAVVVPARRPGILAVFGSVERRGRFSLESGSRAVAVLGNVELDLRDVVLPDGVTELHVRAVLGNVEITVPPTLAVECEGSGVFGNFSSLSRIPPEGGGGPVLRVMGRAVLGNVEIHTRPRRELEAAAPKLLGRSG